MTYEATWDLSTIPDAALRSEWARRSSAKRKTRSGGILWRKHNPDTPRCRCADCTRTRKQE